MMIMRQQGSLGITLNANKLTVLETGIVGLGPGKSDPECNNSAVTHASKDSLTSKYCNVFDMRTQE